MKDDKDNYPRADDTQYAAPLATASENCAGSGRELPEFPEHVTYNFGCPCGWWGIARIPLVHAQATCPRCEVTYRQWNDGEMWRLSAIVQ